jgi:hypothetical protein
MMRRMGVWRGSSGVETGGVLLHEVDMLAGWQEWILGQERYIDRKMKKRRL